MVKRWVLFLIAFSLVVGLGLGALMDRALEEQAARLTQEAEQAQESEYYRGIYDDFQWSMVSSTGAMNVAVCNEFVRGADAAGWYVLPSPGYEFERGADQTVAVGLRVPAPVCDVDAVMSLANEAAHLAGRNFGGMLSAQEFRAEAIPVFGSLRSALNACGYRVNERGELVGPGE